MGSKLLNFRGGVFGACSGTSWLRCLFCIDFYCSVADNDRMFVREKTARGHCYLYLVESVREGGRVRK
jgi:hypothetical protein